MNIVTKKYWRVNGPVTQEEFEWIASTCHEAVYHQEQGKFARSFFRRGPIASYVLCHTIRDKEETMLILKFGDRVWECDDTLMWQE